MSDKDKAIAPATEARAIESFVARGDWSGLSPLDRARAYTQVCAQHGLNPLSQPFAFLRLNGKEVLYATRGATDQLAAIHRVTREIVDGPKVVDIAGTKVGYCVARALHPNGRSETATATLPVVDPVNLYMKLETKAKRRATIALLGLAMLDETELATIPEAVQGAASQPTREDLAVVARESLVVLDAAARAPTLPPADAVDLVSDVASQAARAATVGELAALWVAAKDDIARLDDRTAQERAWRALTARARSLGATVAALKAAVAALLPQPPNGPNGPNGGHRPAGHAPAAGHDALGEFTEAAPAQGPVALVPEWCCDEATARAHVEHYTHAVAVQRSCEKHRSGLPPFARRLLALRLVRLSWDPHDGEITEASARELVERWIARGPQESKAKTEARTQIAVGVR